MKSVSFKSRTPKVHQLQAGQMYMHEESICGQLEDLTSSDESFLSTSEYITCKLIARFPQHLILLPTWHIS